MLEQTRGENICYRHLATSDDNEIWRTHTLEKRYDNRKNTNKSQHIWCVDAEFGWWRGEPHTDIVLQKTNTSTIITNK
jgi:hypothetical protein